MRDRAKRADPLDPKYMKKVRRLSDMIRTFEVINLDEPSVVEWLENITSPDLKLVPTIIDFLDEPDCTSSLVQLVSKCFVMMLQMAEEPRLPERCRDRIQELATEASQLPQAVFRVLPEFANADDVESCVALLGLCGVALRFPGSAFDDKYLAELALDLLASGEHLQVLCDFLVCFAVNSEEGNALELLAKHKSAPIFGEVLVPMLNQPVGSAQDEMGQGLVDEGDEGMQSRAQVLAGLLDENSSFLYKNDLKVVLEVLTRELPDCARRSSSLAEAYVDCLGAVHDACEACGIRAHDAAEVFAAVARDELVPQPLRKLCMENSRRCVGGDEARGG
jgi:hypothetical protein